MQWFKRMSHLNTRVDVSYGRKDGRPSRMIVLINGQSPSINGIAYLCPDEVSSAFGECYETNIIIVLITGQLPL